MLLCLLALLTNTTSSPADEALPAPLRYYAHEAVLDRHGVIAPWYRGQNGQCDLRVRIAAETLKRYPWVESGPAVEAAPHYVYNGAWSISAEGTIAIPQIGDWENGDLGQRAAYVLSGLVDYYRYSGDPAAIAHLSVTADRLLEHCVTGPDHPWPGFLISVPVKGKPYAKADPGGFIQLDIVAEVGYALLRAYQVTGTERWLEAAKHWGDLLAAKRERRSGAPPWGRYANPENVPWEDLQTGGVVFILTFLDELVRLGYTGQDDAILKARDAGRDYLREVLLPRWTVDDTWGRNYWDWSDPVQAENVTEFVVRYMMNAPEAFPNWRQDCRNIMSLFLNRTSVAPDSNGDVYSGAWAYPESSACCGRSLCYGPMELATVYAEYAVRAGSEWAREMARRQMILATYDAHETGVVEDNIDGGQIVAGAWFKIAHPMALKHTLGVMAWLPELFGANRENHIMRTSSVVRNVVYGKGEVEYATFDAQAPCVDVLRLAFEPREVVAGRERLPRLVEVCTQAEHVAANGYAVEPLPGGDFMVTLRHDGLTHVRVAGNDPQEMVDDHELHYEGSWEISRHVLDHNGSAHVSGSAGATMAFTFRGNQVRLIGRASPRGGRAEVYLDGQKQLVGLDTWCSRARCRQVLYYRNGLPQGEHTLKVVVLGARNPLSAGDQIAIDGVQWSAAEGDSGFGEGGGPTETQRVILGYTGRRDYVDAEGHSWRPGTEVVVRTGSFTDAVAVSWWTERRQATIPGQADAELYRYGVHALEFTVHFTVGPGRYYARIKLCETRRVDPYQRAMTLSINDRVLVRGLDVAATAGGYGKPVDLVFNGLEPAHGMISIRFAATYCGEAMAQAVEVGPGEGGEGAQPVVVELPESGNLLANPGFEETVSGALGRMGETAAMAGWRYVFAGPTQSYVWGEADYVRHPDWGLPVIRSGKQALRTHSDGGGHTLIFQEVSVKPNTLYRAAVFVHAVNLRGQGFGTHPGDSAGLCIQELGKCGKVLVDHPKIAVTEPCDYTELAHTFATGPQTARVRFVLDTVIGAKYDQGHVTYDDCLLEEVR